MLRNITPEGNLSAIPCPRCGCRGNYAPHGSYVRHLATEAGEGPVRVRRVRCLSCMATHALLPPDVVPYRLYSESLCIAVALAWARGESASSVRARYGLPETSRRRVLSSTRARLRSLLSCPAGRGPLLAALAAAGPASVPAMHAAAHGTALGENRRLNKAAARGRARPRRPT